MNSKILEQIEHWHPAMNLFDNIKYIVLLELERTKTTYDLWAYKNDKSAANCLDYWVRFMEDNNILLNSQGICYYREILDKLNIWEYKNYLMLHYKHEKCFDTYNGVGYFDLHAGLFRECRSVVIDIENDELVTAPFAKFFNIDERPETQMDTIIQHISEAKVVEFSEKIDGSFVQARWYQDKLFASTSSALDPLISWRLEDAYKLLRETRTASGLTYENIIRMFPWYTFMFEYISPEDRHVVNYGQTRELRLIGMRRMTTRGSYSDDRGKELSYAELQEFAKKFGLSCCKIYNTNLSDIVANLDEVPADEAEGFVINIDGWKVKLKYNSYVHIHHILGSLLSKNSLLEDYARGRIDDVIGKIPEGSRQFAIDTMREIQMMEEYILHRCRDYWTSYKEITDKKSVMIMISEDVPRKLQGFVRNMYINGNGRAEIIMTSGGGFRKYKDLVELYEYTKNVEL